MLKYTPLFVSLALFGGVAQATDNDIIGAPSTIPHPIDSYLPIKADVNNCLMCHKQATSDDRKAGEIPLTHIKEGKVTGDRWNCTLCHAPSTPAETKSQPAK